MRCLSVATGAWEEEGERGNGRRETEGQKVMLECGRGKDGKWFSDRWCNVEMPSCEDSEVASCEVLTYRWRSNTTVQNPPNANPSLRIEREEFETGVEWWVE